MLKHLLALLIVWHPGVSSFVPSPRLAFNSQIQLVVSGKQDVGVKETADKLLRLLLEHANTKGPSQKDSDIESLMQELIDAAVNFDPKECLDGPLYAVAYQYGPTPFWVKYAKLNPSGKLNIEGQQFTSRDKPNSFDAIAYGEFFGSAINLKVDGVCSAINKQDSPENPSKESRRLVSSVTDFFARAKRTDPGSTDTLSCPSDFIINVKNIQLSLFDYPINLGIKGSGKLRVLYADPNLRIFIAPEDSTERYEEKGLTVAQVRVDLLDPKFPARLTV